MSVNMNPAARVQLVTPAAIAVLSIVAIVPLTTVLVNAWPINPGDAPWRYQTISTFLRTAPQLSLAMILIAVVAVHGSQYGILRRVANAALVLAGIIAILGPVFALDFIRVRRGQAADGVMKFTLEGLRLAGTSGLLTLGLFWAGRRGRTATEVVKSLRREFGEGLIVAQVDAPK